MLDLKKVNEELTTYVRPQTFPVAVKLLTSVDDMPAKTRLPRRDLGIDMATCQAISFARRYGWTLAVTKEDQSCPGGLLVAGFSKPNDYYVAGNLAEGMYCGSLEAGAAMEAALPKLPAGKYKAIVVGPVDRVSFDPDLIVMYGNPAQVMRLVQGALFDRGGYLPGYGQGRLDCAEILARTILTDECQWILPCTGDRMFALTADDEMCFTMPASKIEQVLEGLAGSHRQGIRYPVTSYLQWSAKFPPKYQKLHKMLMEQED